MKFKLINESILEAASKVKITGGSCSTKWIYDTMQDGLNIKFSINGHTCDFIFRANHGRYIVDGIDCDAAYINGERVESITTSGGTAWSYAISVPGSVMTSEPKENQKDFGFTGQYYKTTPIVKYIKEKLTDLLNNSIDIFSDRFLDKVGLSSSESEQIKEGQESSNSDNISMKEINWLKDNPGSKIKKPHYTVVYNNYINANTNEPVGGHFTVIENRGRDNTRVDSAKELQDYIIRRYSKYFEESTKTFVARCIKEDINENEDWSGWLVRPKQEWLNPGEEPHPYVVIEDRGSRILIQLLPQYQPKNLTFPCIESGYKEWYEVIDRHIQDVDNLGESLTESGYKKGDRVELPSGETAVVTRDYQIDDDRVEVEIEGMGTKKFVFPDLLRPIYESSDLSEESKSIKTFGAKANKLTEGKISSVEPTVHFKGKSSHTFTTDKKWEVDFDEQGNILARTRHGKTQYFSGHINDEVNSFPHTDEDNIILAAREQYSLKFGDKSNNLTEEAEYSVKFFQVFEAPKSPKENGKMIGQRGTLNDANAFGKEKVGKGNYIIKAVCDDGKIRPIDNDAEPSSYKMVNEAHYGGAYDIDDEAYFTKEDLVEFANDVIEAIDRQYALKFDINELELYKGVLYLGLISENGVEMFHEQRIDMRKIKVPKDLNRYLDEFVTAFRFQIDDNAEYLYEGVWDDIKSVGKAMGKAVGDKVKSTNAYKKVSDTVDAVKKDVNKVKTTVKDTDAYKKVANSKVVQNTKKVAKAASDVVKAGKEAAKQTDTHLKAAEKIDKNKLNREVRKLTQNPPNAKAEDYFKQAYRLIAKSAESNSISPKERDRMIQDLGIAINKKGIDIKTIINDDTLKEDFDFEYDDGEVTAGKTFIESGSEYKWVKRVGEVIHLDFDNWAVWEAENLDDEITEYFVVDEDTQFIDWGPVDTAGEALEFLQSKVEDWEDDEDEYDFIEFDESYNSSIREGDKVRVSTPGNATYDGRTGVVDWIDDVVLVVFDDDKKPRMNNFDKGQVTKIDESLTEDSETIKFANNIDKDLIDGLSASVPEEPNTYNSIKCSKSAAQNILYYVNQGEDVTLYLGNFKPGSNISHCWITHNGELLQTHVPSYLSDVEPIANFSVDLIPNDIEASKNLIIKEINRIRGLSESLSEDGEQIPVKFNDDELVEFPKLADYCDELNEYLKAQGSHERVYPNHSDDLTMTIESGDWKHDHIWNKNLIREFFKEKGIEVGIDSMEIGESMDDTYTAEHVIYPKTEGPIKLKLLNANEDMNSNYSFVEIVDERGKESHERHFFKSVEEMKAYVKQFRLEPSDIDSVIGLNSVEELFE